ncbi:hypothetical protein ADK36_23370 [Streptomyces viridochromogenes]|nr:hypothetical protein ADK36_23370 [Streptomyces viridochromogenes]
MLRTGAGFHFVGGGPRQAPSVDPYQALQAQVVAWDDVVLPALGDMDDLCRGGIDLLGRVLEGFREGCTRGTSRRPDQAVLGVGEDGDLVAVLEVAQRLGNSMLERSTSSLAHDRGSLLVQARS